ncbi:MAG: hypothetical protein ABGX27_07995 [Desulfurobacteriaceae bacterium]
MDFGIDIYCINGDFQVLPSGDLTLVSGLHCLAQDIINRLKTVKGSHFAHPDYGIDLHRFIKRQWDPITELDLLSAIGDEVEKDPRVLEAKATRKNLTLRSIEILLTVTPVGFNNPFNLIISIDRDSGEVYAKVANTREG